MKWIFTFLLLGNVCYGNAQTNAYLLIGTYTGGDSKGIYVYSFDTLTATTEYVSTAPASNPSYLAVSNDEQTVYCVNEDASSSINPKGGAVSAYHFSHQTGQLKIINTVYSGGKHPCYVAVNESGKWLFAGNYSSGTIGLFPLGKGGEIIPYKQLIQLDGNGPDTGRQLSAHVHSTVLNKAGDFLYVPDLGSDKVMIYRFSQQHGLLTASPTPFANSIPGSGPRHFVINGDNTFAYLVEELKGTVVVYKIMDDSLLFQQRISAVAADFKGYAGSADIHISADGKFLYSSNRGQSNSICIFKIDQQTGLLNISGYQSSLGLTPRNFNTDPSGNFLLVANQDSNEIVIFSINRQTGLLTDTGKRIPVPSPVCIKWIRKN